MLLNSLSQQYTFYLGTNFFYPEIVRLWEPEIKRMGLPYRNLDDFMNAQIKSVTFDNISQTSVKQRLGQYNITKRQGRPLDASQNKEFQISFRLTESYLTYLILQQAFELYLRMGNGIRSENNPNVVKDLYYPPMILDILSDEGFIIYRQVYHQITPLSLSNINLTYAGEISSQKEVTLQCAYNYIDRYRVVDNQLRPLSKDFKMEEIIRLNTIEPEQRYNEQNIIRPIHPMM